MKLISHRGNIDGPNPFEENDPDYIREALLMYDVEIDLWFQDGCYYLGHDEPKYLIDYTFLLQSDLWIHCKNIDAMYACKLLKVENYFYHQTDEVTLTSSGYFWTYPGKKLTKNSIAVLPELASFDAIETAYGICSDYITNYEQ